MKPSRPFPPLHRRPLPGGNCPFSTHSVFKIGHVLHVPLPRPPCKGVGNGATGNARAGNGNGGKQVRKRS